MIEQLFGSKTRVKLLRLFFSNPNRSFFVREITRKIDEQINSVRRELSNLLNIGIITSDNNNNKLYYEVNQKFEHYPSLSAMFSGSDIAQPIKKPTSSSDSTPGPDGAFRSLGNVKIVLLTGQFTRDERSGVDLVVVGDINQSKLEKFVAELEKQEGKELRYTSMTMTEFEYRSQVNDRFLMLVLASKYQTVIDSDFVVSERPEDPEPKEPAKPKKEK